LRGDAVAATSALGVVEKLRGFSRRHVTAPTVFIDARIATSLRCARTTDARERERERERERDSAFARPYSRGAAIAAATRRRRRGVSKERARIFDCDASSTFGVAHAVARANVGGEDALD